MAEVTICSDLGAQENKACHYFHCFPIYLPWSDGLDEAWAGIKIARRNINNFRYADDITLMAQSEDELKKLLMRIKEESGKSWLKAQNSEN